MMEPNENMAEEEFSPGPSDVINNRYRIMKKLGEGAMGAVFLVEDSLRDNQRIAIKIIKREIIDQSTLINFKHEFDVMTRLKHPNLARVYDFGSYRSNVDRSRSDGSYYITMEYIDGRSLKELTCGRPPFDVQEALSFFVTLCRAIDFIHSRGILHRDIKPGNILLSQSTESKGERVKILDFGLSDLGVVEQSKVKGTIPFLAPEVIFTDHKNLLQFNIPDLTSTTFDFTTTATGKKLDERVDIYALGITFYSLLTGRTFFEEDSLSEIIEILEDEELFSLHTSQALKKIEDGRLRHIIGNMISYFPRSRYNHLSKVIFDINALMHTNFPMETPATLNAYLLGAGFVGRHTELEFLQSSLRKPGTSSRLVLVKGEIGVGKSRLFNEFRKLCQLAGYYFIEAECVRHLSQTYAPIIDWLNEILYYAPGQTLEEYGPGLKKLLPAHPRLSEFSIPTILDPRSERHLMINTVSEFLLSFGLSSRNRTVLYINDLHWADDGSLAILEVLLGKLKRLGPKSSGLSVYACARTEEFDTIAQTLDVLKREKVLHELTLLPFEANDVSSYIQATFGQKRIDESIEKAIPFLRDKIGGNPFFLQELIKSLVDQQIITRRGVFWELTGPLEQADIPVNLTSIIIQRLSRLELGPLERELLQTICLLNTAFTAIKVYFLIDERSPSDMRTQSDKVAPYDIGLIQTLLFHLTEQEILVADESKGEYSYRFIHDLLREAIEKQSLDPSSIHRTIAARLENYYQSVSPEELESDGAVDELAHHFRLGGITEKAIIYLEKAAENARKRFAIQKAITFYTQLLDMIETLKEPDKAIDIMLRIGSVYGLTGEWTQGEKTYIQAINLADNQRLEQKSALARHDFGRMLYLKNDYNRSMQCLIEAKDLFLRLDDTKGQAMVLREIGSIHWRRSEFEQAMDYADQSLEMCEQLNDKRELSYALKLKGDVYTHLYDYRNAINCLEQFRSICAELDDMIGMSSAANNMGVVNLYMGNLTEATNHYQQALKIHLALGNKQGQSIVYCNMADVFRCLGEYHQALDYLDRAIKLGRSLDINHHLSSYLIDKARLLYHIGRHQEARKNNLEGLQMAVNIGRKEYILLGRLYQIKIELALGKPDDPDQIQSAISQLGQLVTEATGKEDKAALHYELWKLTKGEDERVRAIELYEHLLNSTRKNEFQKRLQELRPENS